MVIGIGRRELIAALGGATVAWPFAARAQQAVPPMVGFIDGGSLDGSARYVAAFGKGINETGFVEGQNVTVEYHYLEGQYDRLPALMADLVRRQVAVIATPALTLAARAAKAATATIPIVFGVGGDRSSLVLSQASPGPAATRPNRAGLQGRRRPSRTLRFVRTDGNALHGNLRLVIEPEIGRAHV